MRSDPAELAVAPLGAGLRDQVEEVARLYPLVYRMFHTSHHTLPGTEVTPRMLGVLQHLAAAGPLTLSELALHLSLSKAATTELVDRLERKELVARMHDERDRRRVFIWLTDSGRERASEHPRVLEDELLLAALTRMAPDDRQALIDGMRALVAARKELSS
jgi:DNA-binding MarR family transcriptional regulator